MSLRHALLALLSEGPKYGLIVVASVAIAACSRGDDGESEGAPLPEEAGAVLAASSDAMAAVTSVRFELERSGAEVFIDDFDSLALDSVKGRFAAPARADAVLQVTVDGSLTTELGAVAIDDDAWLSNPVTGRFEEFGSGYDLDPSTFFDPVDGWGPLMAGLQDAELIGVEDRGGNRYHIRGVAPAEQVEVVTAGLIDDEDVAIDFWLRRDTGLVTAAEFETTLDGATTSWVLELSGYGDEFEIEPPDLG